MNIEKSALVKYCFLFITTTLLVFSSTSGCTSSPNQTPIHLPSTPIITNTPSSEEQITVAFNNATIQAGMQPPEGEYFQPMQIQIEGEWAIIEATYVNNLGTPTVGEGAVFIGRLMNGNWQIAIPGTDVYRTWLNMIPETLLPEELKLILR